MFDRPKRPPETVFNRHPLRSPELNNDERAKKREEKRLKRRNTLFLKISAVALAATSISTAYWTDVESNRTEQAAAEISINVIADPIDETNSNKATIFFDGFNAYDADPLAGKIGPAAQQVADGELWSLSYNNALLSREKIYESIIDLADERGITSISLAGYSMGGVIAAEATSDIVTKSTIDVNSLLMMSMPDGSKALRSYQTKERDFLQWLAASFPSTIDSSYVRFAGEMYFYRDNYLRGEFNDWWDVAHNAEVITKNVEAFGKTYDAVLKRFDDPKRTSMQLLSEQVYKIDQFDMLDELKHISEQRNDKQMPVLLYLGTGKPGYDYIVNDKLSSANFSTYTKKTGLQYFNYLVPGAIHSQYSKTVDQYMTVFSKASKPMTLSIQAEAARHALNLFAKQEKNILQAEELAR